MNLSNNKKTKWNCLSLAFLFPFVGMLFVMLISQYEPFSNKYAILYSDMYHQYYPFFVAYRDALRSGDGLMYSWSVGLGMDYLGLISYYLASPLYLLSVLVPESLLLEFFCLLMPVKLGLAGLFFGIFLKNTFHKDDLSVAVFATFYALCAWALGYQWNIMWLDTFALLPLVVLGMVKLLRDKKFILYTVSLFMAVFANYYVGFFVCIFVLLLFFIYEICRWQGWKRFFGDLVRIACFSLLAIAMTAILELPAFAALQNTQSSVNSFPTGFKMNIADENTWKGLLDAMRQVAGQMGGGSEPTFKEGLPNIYCGVGSLMLAFLYLMAKEVKLRDKICAVVLLVFFMLSFILRQLDYIWHGFHFTNMIPYRFSFLYSFVVLYMAYKAWTLRQNFRPWQVLLAMGLSVAIVACADGVAHFGNLSGGDRDAALVYIAYNLVLMTAYGVVLLCAGGKKKLPEDADEEQVARFTANRNRRLASVSAVLLAVMAVEQIANLTCFGVAFTGTSISNYPKGTEHTASVIAYMHEREDDNLFFRAETTHSQTLNDGAINGYNGISSFTSSANVKVTEFMKMLGYGAKNTYNRYCYEEASPVSDLFLGIKYMIERDGKEKESAYYTEINRFGKAVLLENNAYLPLGFLAEPELGEVNFAGSATGFRFQNELLSAATGIPEDVWMILSGVSITATDVTVDDQNSSGYCYYENGKKGGTIVYSYTVETDGFMCVDLNMPKRNNVSIWKNGAELYSETMSLQQMMAVGDVAVGDVVEVHASCKNSNESGTITITAAILNEERFRLCHEVLAASTLELTSFENTRVEGEITCDRDGLLYTSIPQNGNWNVTVDGEPAEIVLTGDVMVGVMLTEGTHEVVFTYRNAAFSLGWKITLVSVMIFAALVFAELRKREPRGKYVRKKEKH